MTLPDGERADAKPAPIEAQPDELDTLLRPRLTRRARLLRAGALLGLVLVVAIGLFWRVESTSVPFAAATLSPTAAPPLMLIESNVNFGTLSVNGHRVAGPPAVFRPRPGKNTITLAAAPFAPKTCSFSWPGFTSFSGNCGYGNGSLEDIIVGGQHYRLDQDFIITVQGDQLPPEVCAQVREAVAAALAATQPTTKVPVGQYIATGVYHDGVPVIQRAATPLIARLVATLPAVDDAPCLEFDEGGYWGPNDLPSLPGHHWLAWVSSSLLSMRFSTPSGREVSSTHDYDSPFYLNLASDAAGRWTIADLTAPSADDAVNPLPLAEQIAQSLCEAAGQDLQDAMQHAHLDTSLGWGSSTPAGMQAMQGCRLWLNVQTTNSPSNSQVSFVWRLGVLYAVDAAAHKLLPAIPLAPEDVLAAVPEQ